jgi:hypothetical protein
VPEDKGQKGGEAEVSAQPVPSRKVPKASPPPGGPESTGGPNGEGGSPGKKKPAEPEEVVEKCNDPADTCSIDGKLSACLQISEIGNFSSQLSLNFKSLSYLFQNICPC